MRLQVFRPDAVVELVPFVVPDGVGADGKMKFYKVPDRWAMPGGGNMSTAEVHQLAAQNGLSIKTVR